MEGEHHALYVKGRRRSQSHSGSGLTVHFHANTVHHSAIWCNQTSVIQPDCTIWMLGIDFVAQGPLLSFFCSCIPLFFPEGRCFCHAWGLCCIPCANFFFFFSCWAMYIFLIHLFWDVLAHCWWARMLSLNWWVLFSEKYFVWFESRTPGISGSRPISSDLNSRIA